MTSFPSENMKKSDKTGLNGNQLGIPEKGLYCQSKITRHVKNFISIFSTAAPEREEKLEKLELLNFYDSKVEFYLESKYFKFEQIYFYRQLAGYPKINFKFDNISRKFLFKFIFLISSRKSHRRVLGVLPMSSIEDFHEPCADHFL